MNTESEDEQWYKDLDISSKGKPTGIEQMDTVLSVGLCYCIVTKDNVVERVDVYEEGHKIHYKKFRYDNLGRVIENKMYSPDGNGGWHNVDDIWYYVYDEKSGLRRKKIIKMPNATTAREILYNKQGNRTSETVITV
jgi:hypothetical protein